MDLIMKTLRSRYGSVKFVSTDIALKWLAATKAGDSIQFQKATGLTTKDVGQDKKSFDRLVLVEVREPAERAISWIPGSSLVSPKLINEEIEAVVKKAKGSTKEEMTMNTAILVYCAVGFRASKLTVKIDEKLNDPAYNFVKAYNMEGGIFKWSHEDKPLIGKEGPTKFVHPCRSGIDFCLDKEKHKWQ